MMLLACSHVVHSPGEERLGLEVLALHCGDMTLEPPEHCRCHLG